jgi:hypothetical protein
MSVVCSGRTARLHGCIPMSSPTPITSVEEEQDIRCPICSVVAVGGSDVCNPPSCAHLRFIYLNGEAFGYADTGLEDWLQAEEDRTDTEGDSFNAWDALQRYIEPDGMILERIDHHMSYGPTKLKIWVGVSKSPASV